MVQLQSVDIQDHWQRELARAYKSPHELGRALQLPDHWVTENAPARELFPMLVPRPFVRLMEKGNLADPLLRQVWPLSDEFEEVAGFTQDPLGEDSAQAVPGMLHKYTSRALLIVRGGCAVNCRYCFRRHFPYQEHKLGRSQLTEIGSYLISHPHINEIILSGGDPLMASDARLETLIEFAEQLPQVKRLRIHSRLPVVLPARLTRYLAKRLNESRLQTILVIHANHPQELGEELREGLELYKRHGIWLFNQSVLLSGVNDQSKILVELSEKLFAWNVMPYYLHQLDKVAGAAHFAVSDAKANQLMSDVLKALPGFLVPKLVRELGGEASKTPINIQL